MTKGEARKLYLRWLDEATINGQESDYEQRADLEDKFDYFLNGAVFYLAGHFRLPAVYRGEPEEAVGDCFRYRLPEDFRELDKIVQTQGGIYREIQEYHREGERDYLVLKEEAPPRFLYWKNPAAVSPLAPEGTVLELHPRAEMLAPLKTAVDATAGTEDMAGISGYLEGLFSNMLINLSVKEDRGRAPIETIYRQV